MPRWAKAIIVVVLMPALLFVAACYGLYGYGAMLLPRVLEPTQVQSPQNIRNLYWISLGGRSSARIERLGPVRYALKRARFFVDVRRSSSRPAVTPGDQALSQSARLLAFELTDKRPVPTIRRHLVEIALMIRISQEWTTEQVIDTVLQSQYYGRDAHGLDHAARAWFGQESAQLTAHQQMTLLVLTRAPRSYEPLCHRDRFLARYAPLLERTTLAPDPDATRALAGLVPARCDA